MFEREWRDEIERVRQTPTVDYKAVRELKGRALRASLRAVPQGRLGARHRPRGVASVTFIADESWWLDEYSLYRALRARRSANARGPNGPRSFAIASRLRLHSARERLDGQILFYQYVQWIASRQWQAIRAGYERDRNPRRFSVHGDARQRRRLEPPARFPARRVGRHAARCVQRNRPGMGTAAVQLG